MKREIKFRAWDKTKKAFCGWDTTKRHLGDWADRPDAFPEIVLMQFTGLFDRHGVEIYEGDIVVSGVKTISFSPRIIEWDEWGGYTFFCDGESLIRPNCTVVIGNIYQNPELIK